MNRVLKQLDKGLKESEIAAIVERGIMLSKAVATKSESKRFFLMLKIWLLVILKVLFIDLSKQFNKIWELFKSVGDRQQPPTHVWCPMQMDIFKTFVKFFFQEPKKAFALFFCASSTLHPIFIAEYTGENFRASVFKYFSIGNFRKLLEFLKFLKQ